MSIFNKGNVLERVIKALIETSSELVTEYIFVLDGCTDNSEAIVHKMVQIIPDHKKYMILYTNNVFEIRSNNVGIKNATQPYVCIVQDDMEILETSWDKRMLEPFKHFDDIFAITARTAARLTTNKQFIDCIEGPVGHNCFDKNITLSRDIVYINQIVNRGPLMLDLNKFKILNYFDETLPGIICCDDVDLCIKAFIKYGWRCGCYWIHYNSPLEWGSSRSGPNTLLISHSDQMNLTELCNRYYDFLRDWDKTKYYEERVLEDINKSEHIQLLADL